MHTIFSGSLVITLLRINICLVNNNYSSDAFLRFEVFYLLNIGGEILVVDDDEVIRQLLTHRLRGDGYDVRVCEDGRAAAALFDEGYEPSLAIFDIMMPRLDGTRLLRMVRSGELAVRSDLPVVMLTSRCQEEHVLEGFDSGAGDYVTEPFHAQELLARVRRYANA